VWDNKENVILSTLKGEGCKCPPNLQWIKRAIEGSKHLNSLGFPAKVSQKFMNELKEYDHGLQIRPVD
jgi:hypothetical protein